MISPLSFCHIYDPVYRYYEKQEICKSCCHNICCYVWRPALIIFNVCRHISWSFYTKHPFYSVFRAVLENTPITCLPTSWFHWTNIYALLKNSSVTPSYPESNTKKNEDGQHVNTQVLYIIIYYPTQTRQNILIIEISACWLYRNNEILKSLIAYLPEIFILDWAHKTLLAYPTQTDKQI